jgi:hypothetical protein
MLSTTYFKSLEAALRGSLGEYDVRLKALAASHTPLAVPAVLKQQE